LSNIQARLSQANELIEKGLNLIAVFNLCDLDRDSLSHLEKNCSQLSHYRQLILVAHGGKKMWETLQKSNIKSDNPVDDFSIQTLEQFFLKNYPECKYEFLYPNNQSIGLQNLWTLAGWHHSSPFKVGINQEWGSWFAYRAVLLTDSNFELTETNEKPSPCQKCQEKNCINNCPANALDAGEFRFKLCIAYRKKENSLCRDNCLARYSCPVAQEHRYGDDQIHYHYSVSMKMIEELY